MAVVERKPFGRALGLKIRRKVEDIKITRGSSSTGITSKCQMPHIRGEGRIAIVVLVWRKSDSSLLACFDRQEKQAHHATVGRAIRHHQPLTIRGPRNKFGLRIERQWGRNCRSI